MTVGQEFGGWANLIERDVERLKMVLHGLYDLAIGGTAVGTGLNSHPEFARTRREKIAELTGFAVSNRIRINLPLFRRMTKSFLRPAH